MPLGPGPFPFHDPNSKDAYMATKTPARKPAAKTARKGPAVKEVATKAITKARASARATKEPPQKKKPSLDVTALYSDSLDVIAKRQGFESSSLDVATPTSTSLLCIDMILGGGLRACMITGAGEEQCAKTTLALIVMAASIKDGIPIIAFADYEGCVTKDTKIGFSKGRHARIDKLFDLSGSASWVPGSWIPQNRTDIDTVETGHDNRGTGVRTGGLYYRGEVPTTKVTFSNGSSLTGYHHPVFVLTDSGLVQKNLEDLVPGDKVLAAKSFEQT